MTERGWGWMTSLSPANQRVAAQRGPLVDWADLTTSPPVDPGMHFAQGPTNHATNLDWGRKLPSAAPAKDLGTADSEESRELGRGNEKSLVGRDRDREGGG